MLDQQIRVLLVEDNPGDARLLREMLAEAGATQFKLTHVERLQEALMRLSEGGFDVVLLDLSLPDGYGLDIATQVHTGVPSVPIVVLTGLDDETLAVQAVQKGAQDYLVKGQLDPRLLVRAMRYAIERHRLLKELELTRQREHYLSHHDDLTNLPNRTLLMDRLRQALTRAPWHKWWVAVLFIDLDRFKRINDTLGHNLGDLLLKEIAGRLIACVRNGDTVARLGGDEFTIILADMAQAQDIPKVVPQILNCFSKSFILEGHETFITASIGISLYPNDGEDPETLLKNADTAMYRAKEEGRNNYQHFSPAMNVRTFDQLALENNLRRALERNEFLLYYQPQVSFKTRQIIGMEALLRWRHPDLGLVSPARFIPVAEETGLIVPIGEWVLRTACTQNKAWQIAGLPSLLVAVNLSARQFQHKGLVEMIKRVLNETRLDPKYLELELTESILMRKEEDVITTLCELNAMGIGLSIDDFGTGYSSLSYLKRFPIHKLKIDRSFVRDIATDPDDPAIVRAVIALAHSLNMKAIAEGVETAEQLEFLRSLQCDEMQGYLFSLPLPAEEVTKLLTTGKRL